ncbi:unnamed protein product, partial [Medioppia subpectinata]
MVVLCVPFPTTLSAIDNVDYEYEYDNDVDPQLDDRGGGNSQVMAAADDTVATDSGASDADIPGGDGHRMPIRSVVNKTAKIGTKRPKVVKKLPDFVTNNETKVELFAKLMRNPTVVELVDKLRMRVGNFSRAVRVNLRNFADEAKQGVSEDSVVHVRNSLMAFIESLELSPLCLMSFVMMKKALDRNERWPLKFYDSMQIKPTGLLEGSFTSLGLYSECLDIENEHFPGIKMKGQYCLAKVELPFMYPKPNNESQHRSPLLPDNNTLKLLQ